MNTHRKLTLRDFAFVHDRDLEQLTYQNGPYMILVGGQSYSCSYRGQTFSWGLITVLDAVAACARHEARRLQEGK